MAEIGDARAAAGAPAQDKIVRMTNKRALCVAAAVQCSEKALIRDIFAVPEQPDVRCVPRASPLLAFILDNAGFFQVDPGELYTITTDNDIAYCVIALHLYQHALDIWRKYSASNCTTKQ